jgi:P27 family predicted phage terminase small subunit
MARVADPTRIRILKGNPRQHALPKHEPKPKEIEKAPKAPSHLSELAVVEWKRVCGILSKVRVITEADLQALAIYCASYAQYVEATEKLREEGMTYIDNHGFPKINPYFNIARQILPEIIKLMMQFGLTPASRPKIIAESPKNEENEFLKLTP